MPTSPLVSVCLPVYNAAGFLPRAIDCIARQTYKHLEVVIVDDGSIDASGTLAEELLERYGIYGRVIRTTNHGAEQARDRCCENARGEFLATYDADDIWSDDYLTNMVGVLTNNPGVGLVYSDFDEFYEDSGKLISKSSRSPWIDLSKAEKTQDDVWIFQRGQFFSMQLEGQVLFPPCTVFRRSLYDSIGGYSKRLPELQVSLDWWFGLMAASMSQIAFISKPLLEKHRHSSNTSGNPARTAQCDVFVLEALLEDKVLSPALSKAAHRRAAIRAQDAGYALFADGQRAREARQWLIRSLKHTFSARAVKLLMASFLPSSLLDTMRRLR